MALQQRNDEQMDLLRSEFQARYEPNFAWKSACSAVQALPGLRAFYPMSAVGTAGQARDLGGSGATYDLTNNNSADFGYDGLAPYCAYNGTNQYHSFIDNANFDILGNEGYVSAVYRGLTIGGWFRFNDDPPGAEEFLIAKWTGAANRAYGLRRRVGTDIQFSIHDVVAGALDSIDTVALTTSGQWYFCAGRFAPQAGPAEISVILKSTNVDETATNNAGIPATLANSDADFTIAATGVPGLYMFGRASLCFVCAAQLHDAILSSLFQQTRAAFGV